MASDEELAIGNPPLGEGPFTAEERRTLRTQMVRLSPLLRSYENGRVVMRFFIIVGAWVVGAAVTVTTLLTGLKAINWWPFNGPGG